MTQQRRYYVLIAALICSMGVRDGYGTYYNENLIEVGFSSNFCGTIYDDSPCAVCGNGGQELCQPDNACSGSGHENYKDGDYFNARQGGYYVCDTAGSGWVHTDMQPATCDPTTCVPDATWTTNNTYHLQSRTNRYCDEVTPYRSVCIKSTVYECMQNYYGQADGSGNAPVCTPCPSSPDYLAEKNGTNFVSAGDKAQGMTKYPGATTINQCYIPPLGGSSGGYGYIDSTGVYKFVNDCFYN